MPVPDMLCNKIRCVLCNKVCCVLCSDEELLDEYGWMLEEQDDDVASLVVGLVASSSSSSTGSMPQPVLDWLLQQGVKTDG